MYEVRNYPPSHNAGRIYHYGWLRGANRPSGWSQNGNPQGEVAIQLKRMKKKMMAGFATPETNPIPQAIQQWNSYLNRMRAVHAQLGNTYAVRAVDAELRLLKAHTY